LKRANETLAVGTRFTIASHIESTGGEQLKTKPREGMAETRERKTEINQKAQEASERARNHNYDARKIIQHKFP